MIVPALPLRGRRALGALALAAAALLSSCKTTTTVTTSSETTQTNGSKSEGDPRRRAAIRLQLAAGYYQKGQLDVAIKEATEASQIDPNLAAAFGLLGLIYMDLDQRTQAEANFRHSLQLDSKDPELNNNFGWFLCRTKRESEALQYFDQAAGNRMYNTPAMALQNAGICLLQTGDKGRAEKYLVRAFEADASSPVAKYHLARLYLDTHRLERADFYYELLTRSVEPSAETLWLGTRIAHAKSDGRSQQRLGHELERRFPNSPEATRLHREAFDE
jgi:type IV pilus assembly protein PilF